MTTTEKAQRRRVTRSKSAPHVIRLQIQDRMGNPRWITADLVDASDLGISLSLRTHLSPGSRITIRGNIGEHILDSPMPATVAWCEEQPDGSIRAGLELGEAHASSAPQSPAADVGDLDCYEILQLSPNADAETIQRVYRILAQRYHPDSSTGNQEMFMRLSEAHRTLSDPERRAQYDARYRETKQLHWKIFDRAETAVGREGEQRKRQGILEALYAKALHDPEQSYMTVFDFEQLLGCPREHLQASLWYLKGKGYIKRGDNGRFSITILGFDKVEGGSDARGEQKLLSSEGADRY